LGVLLFTGVVVLLVIVRITSSWRITAYYFLLATGATPGIIVAVEDNGFNRFG